MSDARFWQLVDSMLDGAATDDERATVERRMAEDPAIRAEVDARRSMFEALNRVPELDPPGDLHADILRSVRAIPRTATPRWSDAWRSLFANRPALAISYTLAAGIVVGTLSTLATMGSLGRGPGAQSVSGAMAPVGEPLAAERLEVSGGALDVNTQAESGAVRLSVRGRVAGPMAVAIDYDPAELKVGTVDWNDSSAGEAEIKPGRVRLIDRDDVNLTLRWVRLVPNPSPIRVEVRSGAGERHVTLAVTPSRNRAP